MTNATTPHATRTALDDLMTVEEVAARLRVQPSWVYLQSESGGLPSFKVGRYLRFSAADLEAWLRSRRQTGEGR